MEQPKSLEQVKIWQKILEEAKLYLKRTKELKQQIEYFKEKLEDQPKSDNLGIKSTKISKPVEIMAIRNASLSELENWLKAVIKTEGTLNEKEKVVLATWRWEQRKGWKKEDVYYFLFKKDKSRQDLHKIFCEIAIKCAAFYFK